MKKTTKRVLAFVLTLLTVVSLFSLSVAAVKSFVPQEPDKIVELGSACEKGGSHEIGADNLIVMVNYSCDASKKVHYIQYYCTACGKNMYMFYDNQQFHTYEPLAAKAPTCTEAGTEAGKKCIYCGHVEGAKVIPASNHTDNNKDGKCDVCKADIPGACKYCYNVHGNSFSEKITSFFHGILASLGMHK